MGLTVTQSASLYYNMYSLKNSDTYQDYAVDSSSVSKEKYNISSLSNALDAMQNVDTSDFSSITNVSSYAKSLYHVSQLPEYETLKNSASLASTQDLLANNTDMTYLYNNIGSWGIVNSTSKSVWSNYAANATASESSDSSEVGSIIDLLA